MPNYDFIDTGAQPGPLQMGWLRLKLCWELSSDNDAAIKQSTSYEQYEAALRHIVSAHITGNPDFLSKTPQQRELHIARLIERSLSAENYLRKELLQTIKQIRHGSQPLLKRLQLLPLVLINLKKQHFETPISISKYPNFSADIIHRAIQQTDSSTLSAIVQKIIEPSLNNEIKEKNTLGTKQLFLALTSK